MFENKKKDFAFAEHADTCQGSIQWENTSILACEHQFLIRSVCESLEIQHQGTAPRQGINKDIGRYLKTSVKLLIVKTIRYFLNHIPS